tara:strand:+ start:912 stop:1097 length:186 start_codon:yes stop_codon:yes gene_type:complete
MTTANLNNFSITDADMQIILDGLAVDMDQILAGLNFDLDSILNILAPSLDTDYLKSPSVEG